MVVLYSRKWTCALVGCAVAALFALTTAVAQSTSGCLNDDTSKPINWTLSTTPEGSSWTLSSHAYTLSDDIVPQPEKVPFTVTFWRRSACPTQLIATLNMSGSALTIGVFNAFGGGTSSPILGMVVNDPTVYGLGNLLPLSGAPPSPGVISGIIDFTTGDIDASQALTVDFTPISISGPESVVSVQIPAAVTQPFAIGPGITGNWFDSSQNGHGFSIEVLPSNQLLAEWYVFDSQGRRDWIIGAGPIAGNTATVIGAHTSGNGAYFPPNFDPTQIQNTLWGTITFTFTDCNNGTVAWQPVETGYTAGSIPINRLTIPAGLTCP
jgi:hypothetical protein